jgi:uncharacterized Zn finger protein
MMPLIQQGQIRNRATAQSYARGKNYYDNDAVWGTVRRGNELEGRCEGSEDTPYHVRATLDEKGNILETWCTCDYDWEGDCKHVVALLLTYAHEPETFEEYAPVEDMLAERSQEELIALIRQMVARYPDLQALIDRPVPSRQPEGTLVDTAPFRHELQHALRDYRGWGDHRAQTAIESVADVAREFADAGKWYDASAIYRTILEECLHKEQYPIDDEGEYIWALRPVLESIVECLAQDEIAADDSERIALIDHLLDAYIWDVDMGGQSLIDGILPDGLLQHARPADLPRIRERLLAAQQSKLQSEYGSWEAEAYARLLMQLDALDSTDPEETLQRLRAQGMYRLLFERLLAMGRADEAITVVSDHLTNAHERLMELRQLDAAGHGNEAMQLAKAAMHKQFDSNFAHWLAERYEAIGDRNALFELWLRGMMEQPNLTYYHALMQAAEAVDKWATVHPLILKKLEQEKQFTTLVRVYLYDEEWDAAWETLERLPQQSRGAGWGDWTNDNDIDLEVAQKSQHARPQKAIPVFVKYARQKIDARNRGAYSEAAAFLLLVCDLYRQINDEDSWRTLISGIRAEFRRLPALQDELNQAGL